MKHMWSEEELQNLIEEQGGSGGGSSILENIVDSNGNKRFVEGNVIGKYHTPSHITFTYGKWSLSGTHLMIVLFFTINTTSKITQMADLCQGIEIPKWIVDKLKLQNSSAIEKKNFYAYDNDSYMTIMCQKYNEKLYLKNVKDYSAPEIDTKIRIQFDFLIDNE